MMSYNAFQCALLLGEADFSFTNAFSQVFDCTIIATEFLSGNELLAIYPQLARTIADILSQRSNNVPYILAGVDATRLADADCSCLPYDATTLSFASTPTQLWKLLAEDANKTPPIDLVIFNCPHTEKFGKAPKLLKRMFAALERLILLDEQMDHDKPPIRRRLSPHCIVELRLLDRQQRFQSSAKVRAGYRHETAAADSHFQLMGVYDNDLATTWEPRGYQHCISGQNRSCGRGLPCHVWRWQYHEGKE